MVEFFNAFKPVDIRDVMQSITSTASLDDGLWGDKSHRKGAPRDVRMGVARETAPASSTIFDIDKSCTTEKQVFHGGGQSQH